MTKQCLDRRIGDFALLGSELAAWERRRNETGATIKWMFDVDRARIKMGKSYPQPTGQNP
jgi:hypothetical protein